MRRDGTTQSRETGGVLAYAAEKLWRTPTSQSENALRGNGMTAETAQRRVDNGHTVNLQDQVTLWYTPTVPNGGRVLSEDTGPTGMTPDGIKRQVGLENQARRWPTITVADSRASASLTAGGERKGAFNPGVTLTDAIRIYSPLAQVTVKTGKQHSKERRSLNPLFVEWLMGWPPGWTLGAWTDFACSATELSRFKQRMRSALCATALPGEAPPAQLALFG